MSGEDILPVKLERLEIVSGKVNVNTVAADKNPFQRRCGGSTARPAVSLWGGSCNCVYKRSKRTKLHFKRPNGKIIRDPILKYVSTCCQGGSKPEDIANSMSFVTLTSVPSKSKQRDRRDVNGENNFGVTSPAQHDFRSLVSGCSQLRISNRMNTFASESFQNAQRRDRERLMSGQSSSGTGDRSRGTPSCSQQALNPPCDVTIDELASYFETLVHIPKKMSTMAEMMYI